VYDHTHLGNIMSLVRVVEIEANGARRANVLNVPSEALFYLCTFYVHHHQK
jgi:hypothetical protein